MDIKKKKYRPVKRYRYSIILLRELVRTDFILRYQNSILGYFWALLRPLFMFAVLYLIFVVFLNIGSDIPNWPVALFLGLVMWEFFSDVTKQGLKAIVKKGGIIRKINFPKYIIIVASSLSALINLGLNLIVVAVFFAISDAELTWRIPLIAVYLIQLYFLGLGLAFILGAMYVKIRDIEFIWEIFMRAGFYVSAVMFPISRVGDAGKFLLLNPVAQTIEDARHNLLSNMPGTPSYYSQPAYAYIPVVITAIIFVVGVVYFRKKSRSFAEDI
jgi:ABC-2 type transport system permease protein